METPFCSVEECLEREFRRGLCRGHYERAYRGRKVEVPLQPKLGTWDAVVNAVLDYGSVPSGHEHDIEFKRMRHRLQRAMRAWVKTEMRCDSSCRRTA